MLVGTASDVILNPRSCSGGSIHTYKLLAMPDGRQKLELQHMVRLAGSRDKIPAGLPDFLNN